MPRPDLSAVAEELAVDLDRAFPAYVRATADGIFTGSLRMLGDRADAEDVVQDTYARAYSALEGYSRERIRSLRVSGWTWTIAANLCRNRLRTRTRRPTAPLGRRDEPTSAAGPEEVALSKIGLALQAALLELPFAQRAAVVLRHVLDLSYEDIATALSRPIGTVRADVHRGLVHLRQEYPEEAAR